MGNAIFDRSTGKLVEFRRWDVPIFDPVTQVLVAVTGPPDRRTKRWDGGTGIRDATVSELSTYDADKLDADSTDSVDASDLLAASMAVFVEEVRALGSTATVASIRARIIAKHKAL